MNVYVKWVVFLYDEWKVEIFPVTDSWWTLDSSNIMLDGISFKKLFTIACTAEISETNIKYFALKTTFEVHKIIMDIHYPKIEQIRDVRSYSKKFY